MKRLLRDRSARFGLIIIAMLVLCAVFAGVLAPFPQDIDTYHLQLSARLDPSAVLFQNITAAVRANPKRVVFAEGEEESVLRAATAFQNSGLGKALLIGREEVIKAGLRRAGICGGPLLSSCDCAHVPVPLISPRRAATANDVICYGDFRSSHMT